MEEAYQALRAGWMVGDRDRERALHLMYLAWWHWAEPDFLTGFSEDPFALRLWHAVFDHFRAEDSSDPEFLFVAAIMAGVTPWMLGDEAVWKKQAERMMARSFALKPDGFSPEEFDGRGDYGEYFAHQSRVLRR